jgi:hypothetical protein
MGFRGREAYGYQQENFIGEGSGSGHNQGNFGSDVTGFRWDFGEFDQGFYDGANKMHNGSGYRGNQGYRHPFNRNYSGGRGWNGRGRGRGNFNPRSARGDSHLYRNFDSKQGDDANIDKSSNVMVVEEGVSKSIVSGHVAGSSASLNMVGDAQGNTTKSKKLEKCF